MAEEKKKGKGTTIALIVIAIIILLFIVLATWQVPYVIKETHTESQAYYDTESYYEQVSTSGCDNVQGCNCLHKSWLGLGACDSCNCLKSRQVIKYHDVPVTKDVQIYCSALNKLA